MRIRPCWEHGQICLFMRTNVQPAVPVSVLSLETSCNLNSVVTQCHDNNDATAEKTGHRRCRLAGSLTLRKHPIRNQTASSCVDYRTHCTPMHCALRPRVGHQGTQDLHVGVARPSAPCVSKRAERCKRPRLMASAPSQKLSDTEKVLLLGITGVTGR